MGCSTEGTVWGSLAVTGTVEHGPHTGSHTQTFAGVVMRGGERVTTGSSSVLRADMKNPRRLLRDYKPAQFYFCNFCNSREKQTDSEGNLKINSTTGCFCGLRMLSFQYVPSVTSTLLHYFFLPLHFNCKHLIPLLVFLLFHSSAHQSFIYSLLPRKCLSPTSPPSQ